MTQSFVLTGTTSWPVPNGWRNTGAFVEGLGAGGKGSVKSSNTVVGGGGGGGEYRKANLSGLTTGNSITVAVGDGTSATPGDTTFAATTLVAKPGGQGGTGAAGAGGTGGTGAAGNANGGAGAKLGSTTGSGGGGAGGPSGAGTTATTQAGGAANGGAVAGGLAGNPGNTSTTFDSTHGCGSGGSGGAAGNNVGFAGGNYGGGSGANGAGTGTSPAVAKGGDGLLCVTYTANLQTITSTTTPAKTVTTATTKLQAVTSSTTPTKSFSVHQSAKVLQASAGAVHIFSVGSNHSDANTTTIAITAPTAIPAGSFIVVIVAFNNGPAGFDAITDSAGNSYTKLTAFGVSPKLGRICYCFNSLALAAADTITANFFATGTTGAVTAFYATGMRRDSSVLEGVSTIADASGTSTAPSATLGATPETASLIVAALIDNGPSSDTFAQDTANGWTAPPAREGNSAAAVNMTVAGGTIISGAAVTYAPTLGTSRFWAVELVAFAPIHPATLVKQAGKLVNSSTSPLASIAEVFAPGGTTTNQSIDATTSPLASLVLQTGKIISATTTPVVSLARSIGKVISASTAAIADVGAVFSAASGTTTDQAIDASTSPVASVTLTKTIVVAISASTSAIASLVAQFSAAVVAVAPKFEGFRRNIGKMMR